MEMYVERPRGEGICRQCMSRLTKSFETATAAILGTDPTTSEEGRGLSLWDDQIFDDFTKAWSISTLAVRLAESAKEHEEEIDTTLDGGDASETAEWVNRQVEIARSVLIGRGYEETKVSIGIDVELAARRELGSFYRRPDPEKPRWVAHVLFRRSGHSDGIPTTDL